MNPKPDEKIQLLAQTNPALQLLAQLDGGRIITDMAEMYPQVIAAVKLTGKKGSLTIKLSVQPDGKGEVQTVDVGAKVTADLPKRDRRATTFFIEPETNLLTRHDPNQREIDFENAAPATATLQPGGGIAKAAKAQS